MSDLAAKLLNADEVPDMSLVHISGNQKFYLGSKPDSYEKLQVPVAISCIPTCGENYSLIEILQIPFADSPYIEDLPTINQFRRWLRAMNVIIDGRDVLIHCYAGMNRSALMMALYLIEYHLHEFESKEDILLRMKKARHPILQNSHFERIIEDWEK